jgi:hypothetical protein
MIAIGSTLSGSQNGSDLCARFLRTDTPLAKVDSYSGMLSPIQVTESTGSSEALNVK